MTENSTMPSSCTWIRISSGVRLLRARRGVLQVECDMWERSRVADRTLTAVKLYERISGEESTGVRGRSMGRYMAEKVNAQDGYRGGIL